MRMKKISWLERKTNGEVLDIAKEKHTYLRMQLNQDIEKWCETLKNNYNKYG